MFHVEQLSKELCNDGAGFITGHWGLGILLCLVGICCSCRAFLGFAQIEDRPCFSSFARYFAYQFLFVMFFGVGLFGILSSTFKNCEILPHATGWMWISSVPEEFERFERDLQQWQDEQRWKEGEFGQLERSRQQELEQELRRLERLQRLNEFRQRVVPWQSD